MIVTVQMADVGAIRTVRSLMRRPDLGEVAGLRSHEFALGARLALSRPPAIRRLGLLAFWDDDRSADAFLSSHPVSDALTGGIVARLRPLRAHGTWPGLDEEVPTGRAVPHAGPVVVLTLARLRGTQTLRFARTSRPAEQGAVTSDGMLWATALVRVPFLATMSIWQDTASASAYAYGKQRPSHSDAMTEQGRKEFHRQSAFIRFAPTELVGSLVGSNPVDTGEISI